MPCCARVIVLHSYCPGDFDSDLFGMARIEGPDVCSLHTLMPPSRRFFPPDC